MSLARAAVCCLLLSMVGLTATAQSSESYSKLLTKRVKADKLSAPQHLQEFVADGKLRLSLQSAVQLALENNSSIQVEETQVEAQKFPLLGAFRPFDPQLQSIVNINRYSYSGFNELQGRKG